MRHEAPSSLFLFPVMPLSSRVLIFDFGQFIAQTGAEYEEHFKMELELCRQAARLREQPLPEQVVGGCRMLLFSHRHSRGGLSCAD